MSVKGLHKITHYFGFLKNTFKMSPKKFMLFGFGLLLAIIISVGLIMSVVINNVVNDLPNKNDKTNIDTQQITKETSKLINDGDINAANALLDKAYDNTKNIDDKVFVLMSKSTIFYNELNYAESLKFAKQANDLNNSASTMAYIAQIYYAMGDSKNAAASYKTAIQYIQSKPDQNSAGTAYYQSKIDAINAEVQQ